MWGQTICIDTPYVPGTGRHRRAREAFFFLEVRWFPLWLTFTKLAYNYVPRFNADRERVRYTNRTIGRTRPYIIYNECITVAYVFTCSHLVNCRNLGATN
jgi:hypothetical protein